MKFTVAAVAAFAGAAQAAYGVTSEAPEYPATSTPASYPEYPASSSKAPEYPSYPASSSVTYPSYPTSKSAVSYTTEVVDTYVTYCPGPTTIQHGTKTYTVTKATSYTITDCPCTISKPVYTTSHVECSTCVSHPTSKSAPVYPTISKSAPVYPTVYPNSTISTSAVPTGGRATTTKHAPTTVPTAGAGKVAALSGAGLAGLLGLAALL